MPPDPSPPAQSPCRRHGREKRANRILWAAALAGATAPAGFFLHWLWPSPAIFALPWFVPVVSLFNSLILFSVAFLAVGRANVLQDTASFWVGQGAAGFAVALLFYALSWPGLLPDGGSFVARGQGTPAWFAQSGLTLFAALLLVAVFVRHPGGEKLSGRQPAAWASAWIVLLTLVFSVMIGAEQHLPALVTPSGGFAPLLILWNAVLAALLVSGALLTTSYYLKNGDALLGYTAVAQAGYALALFATLGGMRRYDLWWYLTRIIPTGSALVVFFGLLYDHVRLIGREKEKTIRALASEEDLRANRAKLDAALASMTDAVCISDAQGRFIDFNHGFVSFHRFKSREECARTFAEYSGILDLFTADGTPASPDTWAVPRALRGETATNAEYTLRRKDTGETWVGSYSFAPLRDDQGRIVGAVVVGRDITERKRAEEGLRQSESFHRQVLESIPGMVFTTRPDGYCDYQSQQWAVYTGVPVSRHLGEGWNKLLHPDDQPGALAAWRAAVEGKAPYDLEYRVRRRDGVYEWFKVTGHPIRDDEGKIVRWFGVTMNIEALKRAERALLTQTERLKLLATVAEKLLRSEDPQAVVEELCNLVLVHLECQCFFNYLVQSPGQKVYLNAYAGIPPEAAAEIRQLDFGEAACGGVAQKRQRLVLEAVQESRDPEIQLAKAFGIQAYCCHPLIVQDELIGTLSFGTRTRTAFAEDEIALMKSVADQVAVALQRLQAEKALQQLNRSLVRQVAERTELAEGRARQLQALAIELIEAEERQRRQFAHLLHDDLQQLLAAAKMQVQAVEERLKSEPLLASAAQLLEESISKSRRLSHELSPAVLHQSGLVAALRWLSGQMHEQFGLQVELALHTEQPLESTPLTVFLFRAVQELLFNIVKHSGVKSGHVALSCPEDALEISVRDRGKGFDHETFAAKSDSGFGIMTIRERASYIGGSLSIESAPGQGSLFTLRVPVGRSARRPQRGLARADHRPPARTPSNDADDGTLRVLFVDDHRVMRQGLMKLIAHQPGIEVVGEAENGREAVEKARELRPAVILMDVSMPVMDGIEATRHIKAEMPHVRVIGLSMHEDQHISRIMREAGAEAFVSKTASTAELLQQIYAVAGA